MTTGLIKGILGVWTIAQDDETFDPTLQTQSPENEEWSVKPM